MKIYTVTGSHMVTLSRSLAALVVLTGCAETERNDGLQGWLKKERIRHEPSAPTSQVVPEFIPVDVPAQFSQQRKGVEPFSRLRLLHVAPTADDPVAKIPVSTEKSSRPTLSLDASPLAGMRLVGSLQRGGESLALLRVNGLIYSARVGDRIGQDQGRITAITLSGLVLREVAFDPTGQPIERVISLALVSEP